MNDHSQVQAARSGLSKHRLEALTDGIFAVAMTLLVLELKLPEHGDVATQQELFDHLLGLIPKFTAWLISFIILAVFWSAHNRAFHFVRAVDVRLIQINILALLFISLLPFSSALVGEYTGVFFSQVFYACNMAALALLSIWQMSHLVAHPELTAGPVPPPVAAGARFRCWSLVAVAALAVFISWFFPFFGTTAFMLMMVLGRIGRKLEQRHAARLHSEQLSSTLSV